MICSNDHCRFQELCASAWVSWSHSLKICRGSKRVRLAGFVCALVLCLYTNECSYTVARKKLFNICIIVMWKKCIFSCSQSLAKSCHLSSIKLNVIRELSLINESLPLWPMFFPSFVEFSSPNLYFTIFLSLQVTLKLAIKIGFLFRGADPPFSHNEKGKGEESDEEYVSLSTWAW